MPQIAVIVGSLRRESFNLRLAHALEKLAPEDFIFQYLDIGQLPLYNQDDDGQQAESVLQFKQAVSASQGLLFVTPEYNRSIPGVLKNALDHASRPYGTSVWPGKPAGVLGASIGAIGTALAQQHLRNVLAYLDVPTLGQPEVFLKVDDAFFAEDGSVASEDSRKFLQKWMDAYVAWVKKHAAGLPAFTDSATQGPSTAAERQPWSS
ncbi:NADPH-dependent FMN reductase [Brachymonas denitrificans]|uniref:NADPH-dependent FMN reductase n=1 Tax=Brachymonas denitrificans TaxID=28220 RepID=UPI003969E499